MSRRDDRALVDQAVEILRDDNVVLGDGDQDYAAADMLEILGKLHDAAGIDLSSLWQVADFAELIIEDRG